VNYLLKFFSLPQQKQTKQNTKQRSLTDPELMQLARVAETTERYEDMCKFVKVLVEKMTSKGTDLEMEERNLLSVAYKNVVGSKRIAWRTLSGGFDANEALIEKYKRTIENELEIACLEVIALLVDKLLKIVNGKKDEREVYYLKMTGDYYRYLAEFRQTNESYKEKSREFYQTALDIARDNLPETHPTRLGLALNFSVCYYEILNQPEKACELAKKSFDDGIEKLDSLTDTDYRDSTLIMQLLRDNLTLWRSEQAEDEEE